ncbi:MAG: leucine-rich repeat domain-containing protein, partial [bacterium]|nr:leucine-rich repeat domain-containing protein [bacterium]
NATRWLTRFGCNSNKEAISKDMITTINSPLTWQMTRDSIDEVTGDKEEYVGMFKNCSNLNFETNSPFNFPQDIPAVGDNFADQMFSGCSNLKSLPTNFNFPQDILAVGDNFAFCMFQGCSLKSLPGNFTLPQKIQTVGKNFVASMFAVCFNLQSLSNGFNFPQNIQTAGDYFASAMFANCYSLSTVNNLKFPTIIEDNKQPINAFLDTFSGCKELNGFIQPIIGNNKEPNSIRNTFTDCVKMHDYDTYVGTNWHDGPKFSFTVKNTSTVMSNYFTLPINTSSDANFWKINWGDGSKEENLFIVGPVSVYKHHYSSLGDFKVAIRPMNKDQRIDASATKWLSRFGGGFTKDNYIVSINTPLTWQMTRDKKDTPVSKEYYSMFKNFTKLETLPKDLLPKDITSIGDNFAYQMFSGCSSLETFSGNFSFPLNINSVGDNFAYQMFYGCSSLKTFSGNFSFPSSINSVGDNFAYQMFSGCSSLETFSGNFSFPLNINSVKDNFAHQMFYGCSSLKTFSGNFSFPSSINSVGDNFAASMFEYCKALSTLSTNFTFPQDITIVKNNFAFSMFRGCENLKDLPSKFTSKKFLFRLKNLHIFINSNSFFRKFMPN